MKLNTILQILRTTNAALKDININNAVKLSLPLRRAAIFPIKARIGFAEYEKLVSADDTSWFIADHPLMRHSFLDKLPLLALPVQDVLALDHLFSLLRFSDRKLSKLVNSHSNAKGQTKLHESWTISLRAKAPFLKA
jgi:hypothetical protein